MAFDKNAEAVEALHRTMVKLREELAKKNQKIAYLENRINSDLETIQSENDQEIQENIQEMQVDDIVMEFVNEELDEDGELKGMLLGPATSVLWFEFGLKLT